MRSKLFVPAIQPDLFNKAMASGADAVCFDMEDAVAADRKSEAREAFSAFIRSQSGSEAPAILVRINATGSPNSALDLKVAVHPAVYAIALPKVETVDDVCTIADQIGDLEQQHGVTKPLGLLLTIESPRGLRNAAELAQSSARVIGLQLGFADLLEPLGIVSNDSGVRQHIRLTLRLAAAEAGVDCYESAYLNFKDAQGFADQLQAARSLGFSGTSCIHPKQIEVANRVFSPTDAEVESAKSIVAASDRARLAGSAVSSIDGQMIDAPVILRAMAILARRQ
jgi:citrate lyase subunit beta/citryl-CoA lyase